MVLKIKSKHPQEEKWQKKSPEYLQSWPLISSLLLLIVLFAFIASRFAAFGMLEISQQGCRFCGLIFPRLLLLLLLLSD